MPLLTLLVVVTGVPEHVGISGAVKVERDRPAPGYAPPPDSVAVSVIAVPTGPPAEAFVLNVGVAFRVFWASVTSESSPEGVLATE